MAKLTGSKVDMHLVKCPSYGAISRQRKPKRPGISIFRRSPEGTAGLPKGKDVKVLDAPAKLHCI